MEGTYLMNGVEVLSQSKSVSSSAIMFGIILLAIGVGLLFIGFMESEGGCVTIAIICLLLSVGCFLDSTVGTQILYKITVSEEVKLSEFNEKYEIISQEGKIYTVRERK